MLELFAALFLVSLFAGLAFSTLARLLRARTGLPFHARVVYADTGAWKRVERPLFARAYALTGKPDYIVEIDSAIIPVEVKPTRTAPVPRESDVMQLAAYGLLIEETLGRPSAVPYGLLKYRDAVFQIDFTEELRARLLELMAALRRDAVAKNVGRSHTETRRCRACGYRDECVEALEDNNPV
ncbi:MAG TPA: PD-(D/E)XK nuclease family protein [Anaerolineae bacterium]